MGRLLALQFLLLPALLTACGEPADPGQRLRLASPLIERATDADGRDAVLIQARGPCRLILIGEGLGGDTIRRELTQRVLPAGRTVGLHWNIAIREGPPEVAGRPTEKEAEEGRTEAHEVVVGYGYEDQGDQLARTVVWTRPGLQRTFRHALPPPARPEPVPFGSMMELHLAVVGDLRSKELKFTPRGALTSIEFVDPVPQDRFTPIRLILRVERP